jgi:large subunit ribosomal protein L9e
MSHIAVNFSILKKNIIGIEIHHGNRKNVAALRTVRTIINNLIIGVTKGFKYKMRYVYAHFPIYVILDKNAETGSYEVEIRYVPMGEPLAWLGMLGPELEHTGHSRPWQLGKKRD